MFHSIFMPIIGRNLECTPKQVIRYSFFTHKTRNLDNCTVYSAAGHTRAVVVACSTNQRGESSRGGERRLSGDESSE